jgi:hypothetical protein
MVAAAAAAAAAAESGGGKFGAWFGGIGHLLLWPAAAIFVIGDGKRQKQQVEAEAESSRGGNSEGENEPYEAGRDVTGDAITLILSLQKSHFQPSTVDNGFG